MADIDITPLLIALGAVMASIGTIVKSLWDKKEIDKKLSLLDNVKVSKAVCEQCRVTNRERHDHVVEKVDDLKATVTEGFTCINKKLDQK